MEKPSKETIDKLFNCFTEFYGIRWTKQFDRWCPEQLAKTVWQSALQGCTYDEIRSALVLLRHSAKNPRNYPPNHLEFFKIAKDPKKPIVSYKNNTDPIVAKRYLDEIRSKLHAR